MRNPVSFEWRELNEAAHVAKHGVPFALAAAVFLDPRRLVRVDRRHDYGEDRYNVIGVVDGRCLNVTFAMRADTAWIISARQASRKERAFYHA